VGANATYLHVKATKSQIESGGTNISGYTNFDGDIRQGNTG
jgi:hypothetical protein